MLDKSPTFEGVGNLWKGRTRKHLSVGSKMMTNLIFSNNKYRIRNKINNGIINKRFFLILEDSKI